MITIKNQRDGPLSISGGCQCGALRYRFIGPLGDASICHCRMCQKAFGSWGAVLASVPFDGFTWTRGTPAEFRSSAIVARGFCKSCGTPMYMREDGDLNIEIAVGTLDDPRTITLSRQSGVESRLPWFSSMPGLPEETTGSYRSAEDMVRLKSLQHPDQDTEI